MVLHALGKAADPYSGGRQLPGHYSSKDLNIISGSSCVATQILHGVGTAFASKHRGENVVSITYFGDGATSKGDFHEAMNFAAVHKLPVIFFCETTAGQYRFHSPGRWWCRTYQARPRATGCRE